MKPHTTQFRKSFFPILLQPHPLSTPFRYLRASAPIHSLRRQWQKLVFFFPLKPPSPAAIKPCSHCSFPPPSLLPHRQTKLRQTEKRRKTKSALQLLMQQPSFPFPFVSHLLLDRKAIRHRSVRIKMNGSVLIREGGREFLSRLSTRENPENLCSGQAIVSPSELQQTQPSVRPSGWRRWRNDKIRDLVRGGVRRL